MYEPFFRHDAIIIDFNKQAYNDIIDDDGLIHPPTPDQVQWFIFGFNYYILKPCTNIAYFKMAIENQKQKYSCKKLIIEFII